MASPGLSSASRQKTAGPTPTKSLWPAKTALPPEPGLAVKGYQATSKARSGASIWLWVSMPLFSIGAVTPRRGMSSRAGWTGAARGAGGVWLGSADGPSEGWAEGGAGAAAACDGRGAALPGRVRPIRSQPETARIATTAITIGARTALRPLTRLDILPLSSRKDNAPLDRGGFVHQLP